MGKGKGGFAYFIARVKTGSIIFELDTYQNTNSTKNLSVNEFPNSEKEGSDILARQAFKVAASKLPLKLRFIKISSTESPITSDQRLTSSRS
jgi:ribosomal protein L16/L10AE